MENAIFVGLSRQMVLQRQMDAVANNIANMNTAGYRSQQMLFETYLADVDDPGPGQGHEMSMVIDQAMVADLRPGPLVETGNEFDLALMGDGFLRVQTPSGPRYTRSGHLSLDGQRQLVNTSGLPLLTADGGTITIPAGTERITITEDGTVSADNAQVGRIDIVEFDEPHRLEPLGASLFVTNEAPRPAEATTVMQGAIESSNVEPIVEMTQMIAIARAYETTQQILQNEHERQQSAIRRLGQMAST
ncbi:MAG: flagellar basal-body rod protein FlgF [Rhodospirillaceae bacterium]|nr:flagellar basal-body rod protein FlgF [Rhodospirillaceae bacterium]